jgi:hypothetical protein
MNANLQEQEQEEEQMCPVCMDYIVGITNKVVTECGHCFHTNCLMANVSYNGFGCPYCRTMMADEPVFDNLSYSQGEGEDNESVDDSLNSSMRGLTEDEYCSYLALISIRRLFRQEGNYEDDDEDDDEDDESTGWPTDVEEQEESYPKPSIEYLVQKLVEEGYTMERFVKAFLSEHDEYDDIEDECIREVDYVFGSLRVIISNYTPSIESSVPVPVTPVQFEENEPKLQVLTSFMRSSYV